jgi:hypothetical protein
MHWTPYLSFLLLAQAYDKSQQGNAVIKRIITPRQPPTRRPDPSNYLGDGENSLIDVRTFPCENARVFSEVTNERETQVIESSNLNPQNPLDEEEEIEREEDIVDEDEEIDEEDEADEEDEEDFDDEDEDDEEE